MHALIPSFASEIASVNKSFSNDAKTPGIEVMGSGVLDNTNTRQDRIDGQVDANAEGSG